MKELNIDDLALWRKIDQIEDKKDLEHMKNMTTRRAGHIVPNVGRRAFEEEVRTLARFICKETGLTVTELLESGELHEWGDTHFSHNTTTPLKMWPRVRDSLGAIVAPISQSETESHTLQQLVAHLVSNGYTDILREVPFTDLEGSRRRMDLQVQITCDNDSSGVFSRRIWIEAKGAGRDYLDNTECKRLSSYARYCADEGIDFILYAPSLNIDGCYGVLIEDRIRLLDCPEEVVDYLDRREARMGKAMSAIEGHISNRAVLLAADYHREAAQAHADHRVRRIALGLALLAAHSVVGVLCIYYLAK